MIWTNDVVVLLLGLFVVKHFIADFVLQTARHYTVKGMYGKWGGIEHSLIHGLLTAVILVVFAPVEISAILALVDTIVHYHVDWAKVNINKKHNWGPTTHDQYWIMLGVDQLLHYLTYLGMVYYLCLI